MELETAIHGDVATKHEEDERINDNRGETGEKELDEPSDHTINILSLDSRE